MIQKVEKVDEEGLLSAENYSMSLWDSLSPISNPLWSYLCFGVPML